MLTIFSPRKAVCVDWNLFLEQFFPKKFLDEFSNICSHYNFALGLL